MTNPTHTVNGPFPEGFARWFQYEEKRFGGANKSENIDSFLSNNFFIFCIMQQNEYEKKWNYDIKKKRKYIGILNSYFLISQEEETIQKNRPPNNDARGRTIIID